MFCKHFNIAHSHDIAVLMLLFYFLPFFSCGKHRSDTLFEKVSPSVSKISFNNSVSESDSINPLDMEFLYNGGGVAVGDFNRDGRPDLYFTASQVSNRMFLNEGNFVFRDVTREAMVTGESEWCNGASVVDINGDGFDDIYVCATVSKDPARRRNLFYINQGIDGKGIPHFKEEAAAYHLADTGFSVHASFFDYDRDGDLDMYLVTTALAARNSTRFDGGAVSNAQALSDKLFRNDGPDSTGQIIFNDVSLQAGIQDDGYGLGITVADLNADGWKDIYVTNDFYTSDKLYLNNRDGTFSDKGRECLKHTAQNAMGCDIADINNDGLPDVFSVDMNPEDNFRKKKNMNGINLFIPDQLLSTGHLLQYVRNTLQLNNGLMPFDSTREALPVFSDISFYAGVAETDWSWNPSLADFDNDGFRDLIVTNGYPKDVTDHDFAIYRRNATGHASKKELLEQIPQVKVPNYAFRNNGDLHFQNVSSAWGLNTPSFSYGAVYVDLDNDGDLDYVVNNINDNVFLYRNKSDRLNHFMKLRFRSKTPNTQGIGVVAKVYAGEKMQVAENTPYRGYLSCVETALHFGLGNARSIDSVVVIWPDGKRKIVKNVQPDQTLTIDEPATDMPVAELGQAGLSDSAFFKNITRRAGVRYKHAEMPYSDFDEQRLLPHKLSEYGPSLAVGDVDGNGLEDVFVGASAGYNGEFLMQQTDGTFQNKKLILPQGVDNRKPEMMGTLLFDADGDHDLDLYVAAGSTEFNANTKNYGDQFFVNDGSGKFFLNTTAIPSNYASKSCVKASDFDKDGDLDLFIGGRVIPHRYPEPASSFIYRNDSKKGVIKFTDVTQQVAPFLKNAGLTCDAIWSDFDNDSWPDLVIASEWSPVTFFRNDRGTLTKISTGVEKHVGWWNSLAGADVDNDGDIDYVAGNLGLNSFFRSTPSTPVCMYAADFNNDGSYDAIPTLFLPDEKGRLREFPANGRDDFLKVLVGKRKRFDKYATFAGADINDLLSESERKHALFLQANYFASALLRNEGNGKFTVIMLPATAQFAPVYGISAEDINDDGNLDVVLCGNDFGNEVVNGQYDALNGVVLLGKGDGTFEQTSLQKTGLYIPGNAKALAKMVIGRTRVVVASQNRGALLLFSEQAPVKNIRCKADDVYAIIETTDGKKRKEELYYGSSFLSQSSRSVRAGKHIKSIYFVNSAGVKRKVNF